MDAIFDMAPNVKGNRVALVILPGAKDCPQDFVDYGFVRALRERNLPIDIVAVDAHMDYYLEGNVIEKLRLDIVSSLHEKGYDRIWFLGISLGGSGALSYTREYPSEVEGIILLAPFLGVRGTIAEVVRAGGLNSWKPGDIEPEDKERDLLAWLKACSCNSDQLPRIYLGYGTEDRYAPSSVLLAERLPSRQVLAMSGGHDWKTWLALWTGLLDRQVFVTKT